MNSSVRMSALRAFSQVCARGWPSVVVAGVSASMFLALGLFIIETGHLHEDAYILFLYAENFAESGVISYFSGGEPAEGATDFLWMVLLSAIVRAGAPTPIAALVVNTLGVFLLTYLLIHTGRQYGAPWIVLVPLAFVVPIHTATLAGLAGFSTPTFAGLALLVYVVAWRASGPSILAVPILGLLLGLFRPDGAIPGVLFALIAYRYAGKHRRAYLGVLSLSGFIGLGYFVWRWSYFGEVLPLPLLVKSGSDILLPGLRPNVVWLQSDAILPLVGVAALLLIDHVRPFSRSVVLTLPFAAHFASLAVATQSQNVALRFNAPSAAAVLLAAVVGLAIWCEESRRSDENWFAGSRRSVMAALVLTGFGVLLLPSASSLLNYLRNDDYINFFPYHFAPSVSESTVTALTEAGRFAYWVPGEKHDLVGLNTPDAARRRADLEYLELLRPDLVFFHRAGVFPEVACEQSADYCKIDPNYFKEVLDDAGTLRLASSGDFVTAASATASMFLALHASEYVIYAVRYGGRFDHLYGIRIPGRVVPEEFMQALDVSFAADGRVSLADTWR
jgi:hypothetical protein